MKHHPVQVEKNRSLAEWLHVKEVALVREDLLPDGGGKKRRSLQSIAEQLEGIDHIHLLSYAGSHTAYTLAQLRPDISIHLYGTRYGGSAYETSMVEQLSKYANIIQRVGSTFEMTRDFNRKKRKQQPGHYYMKIGGSLGVDNYTASAVKNVLKELGSDYHHFVAVASGDLLNSIVTQTKKVTGILTQPMIIRLIKLISLTRARGVIRAPINQRIQLMEEIYDLTGNQWDPIFMGAVFSYLKRKKRKPDKLCIWVTCPHGINWQDG